MTVAVIGMGTMGAPMAMNLIQAGFPVMVNNRTRSREEPLAELGARRAETPRAAAEQADTLLVCVSDSCDVEEVLTHETTGALGGMRSGSLIIDCSTISPDVTKNLAAHAAQQDIGYVDAPVSGGSEGAKKGTLAVMCGGSKEDFERALPVLQAIGQSITHVGDVGTGQITKAVNQVVISGVYQAVAEGIALAARAGADPRRVVEAISGGAARSWVLENRAENMIRDNYPLGFRTRLHRKDLQIALDTARAAGASLPLTGLVAAFEDGLISCGHGDEDMSALARTVRRASGIPDGPLQ